MVMVPSTKDVTSRKLYRTTLDVKALDQDKNEEHFGTNGMASTSTIFATRTPVKLV